MKDRVAPTSAPNENTFSGVTGVEATITAFGDGLQGQERPIGGRWRQARVAFPSSSRELIVRLTGEQRFQRPICVTFTEAAWRRPATRGAALTTTPPPAEATRPVTGPEDHDDDEEGHGHRPRGRADGDRH